IEAIKNLYGKDCVIATAPAIPENRKEIFNKLQEKNRGMFFRGWAMDFMQRELAKDLYILICKEPLHVEIVPSSEVQENILRSKGNAQLHHLLVERLKEKKYDQGLLEAVQFVRSKYDSQVFELYPGPTANAVRDYADLFGRQAVENAKEPMREIRTIMKRPV